MHINEKNSFLLYVNFGKQIRMLSMEERGELITAIFEHEEHGRVEQSLSPRTALVFSFIEDTLDRNRAAYEKKCEQNRENGKRGGRPRKSDGASECRLFSEKTERFSDKAKKADNDIDNGNDSDNDSDNGNGSGNDNEKEKSLSRSRAEPLGTPCPAAQIFLGTLEESEYVARINEGIPGAYIRQREERAKEYSIRHSVSVANVLREWWCKDKKNDDVYAKGAVSPSNPAVVGELGCSFDTDDFFQAALERSMQPW